MVISYVKGHTYKQLIIITSCFSRFLCSVHLHSFSGRGPQHQPDEGRFPYLHHRHLQHGGARGRGRHFGFALGRLPPRQQHGAHHRRRRHVLRSLLRQLRSTGVIRCRLWA